MSCFKGSSQKSGAPVSMEAPWQTAMRKRLAELAEPGAAERITRAGEAYPGELVAPLSEPEQTGISTLGQYLETPLPTEGRLYGLGKAELEKTLAGEEYDPLKGEYYQAYRENLMRELQEAKDRLASRTSARDAFYGGGRVAGEAELEETALGEMREKLGGLYETERMTRLGTVPMATDLLGYEERAPLARIAAAQEFGALPREWEQAGLDAERMEWLRQLTELGIPLDVATQMATYQPPMFQQTYGPYQPSTFSQIAGAAGPLATALPGLLAMSDKRLKENIKPIKDSLDKVKKLEGFTYNFIATPNKREGGIIAQDLEKVMPDAVIEHKGVKFIKLDAVIGLLVNAVNELNEKVNASLN